MVGPKVEYFNASDIAELAVKLETFLKQPGVEVIALSHTHMVVIEHGSILTAILVYKQH